MTISFPFIRVNHPSRLQWVSSVFALSLGLAVVLLSATVEWGATNTVEKPVFHTVAVD